MVSDEQFELMVTETIGFLNEEPYKVALEFFETPEHMLIRYHSSLGQSIRNEFGLWENDWTPEIVDGCDMSDDHPDAISMRVIREVWKRVNSKRFKDETNCIR